ncbi:MAG: sensor domain-containing diguanylate cyclase [Aquabacterium sp.]|jgi:diguanylate cyclase (GGDEF)-like protein|uniref:GGDEF domain-containing protein n=1 Tax=Aquabacterium sp. TaxID=1872578 RepID=UPI002A370706|nr:sensor domain-containing diguanylate cyclase [Aquabacterium sp.]MDX9843684.1 sensor domain-containing diguanylate cyclase [Aquabacterium sp.]
MRLSRLFLCTTALLLGLVSLMLVRTMWTDWQGVRRAESGLAAMELAYAAMQVAEHASAERGPAIPVLNDPPSDALRKRLTQFQQATDVAFDVALTRLRQREEAELLTALPVLERARAQMQAARQELERVAALPQAERAAVDKRSTRKVIDQMFEVVDTVLETVTLLSASAERIHPSLSLPLVGARYATELREHAGRLGSQFTAPLASGSPLGPQERDGIPRLLGRIEQLKTLLDVKARTSLSDPRIDAALQAQQERYFGQSLPFIAELTARGLADQPYGMDSAQFVSRYVPAMRSIVELRDTLHEVGREQALVEVAAARQRLRVNALIGCCILALEVGVFITLRRRVLSPLLLSTRHMVALMRGRLNQQLPPVQRSDEIGQLQAAVHALQASLQRTQELEAERETLITELRQLSHRDHLTGLMNRRAFDDLAPAQLAQSERRRWPLALLLFDLDHFKRINDQHGHETGDQVLQHVAQLAQAQLRSGDLLARYGGEEFIALLPDCDVDAALALAERLRQAMQQEPLHLPDGSMLHLSASFGLATRSAGLQASLPELFSRADAALYAAKAQGRNQVQLAD